ncbi:MAG: glycoside hydrolase family 95 protein [Bacteroides sp.]
MTQRAITKIIIFLFSIFISNCISYASSDHSMRLWYKTPANSLSVDNPREWANNKEWLKALPIGNGYMGAMIYGDVFTERIQLNNKTLWSGSPQDADNKEALKSRDEIRRLLLAGKYKEAESIAASTQICIGVGSNRANAADKPFGCYQTLGDVFLDFDDKTIYTDYHRELDLEKAIVRVTYKVKGNKIERSYFASQPDNVIVMKITSTQKGKLSFRVRMNRPERYEVVTDQGQLLMRGVMNNGYEGEGMKYWARLDASLVGGTKKVENGCLRIENADEVTLYLSSTTNYVGHPTYLAPDYKENTAIVLKKAMAKSYKELVRNHVRDYSHYFNRVSLKLTNNVKDTIPTDLRISAIKKGKQDLHLEELLFQYGRYLLIASSREGTLPANLQGIWCEKIQSAWNGDYHMDINIQMNYWLSQVTNLSELFLPFVDFIESIQEPGKRTANIHYASEGWCVHPIVNIWGFTSPGEGVSWGSHVGASGWLCQNIWEQYAFTQDINYLKRIYPILQNTARFYADWLYLNPTTKKWISIPSISPENAFLLPSGEKVALCAGATHDHQVIRDLFQNYITASIILKKNDTLLTRVKGMIDDLQQNEIGVDGRILEWDQAYKEAEPGHRHISHLYALHPANQITRDTPDLFMAAGKTLKERVANIKGNTAWNLAWTSNFAARLGDANLAYSSIERLLKHCIMDNLFTLGPPFQIEAGFGITAGIAEMLLQSHTNSIDVLPALPKVWMQGEVKGLCARGGYVVDISWKQGKPEKVKIYSKVKDGSIKLRYNEVIREVYLRKGEIKTLEYPL